MDIRLYNVIYDAINEVKSAEGLLSPVISEEVVATIEIRDTFKVPKIGTFGTRAFRSWASCLRGVAGVLLDLGELAADRRPRARFQFSIRRPAGHAHGHHARPERGRLAGRCRGGTDCGGDT